MSVQGRPLPTADVGYPVAQLGGQLSGGEIAHPTSAGRPGGDSPKPGNLSLDFGLDGVNPYQSSSLQAAASASGMADISVASTAAALGSALLFSASIIASATSSVD